MSVALVYTALYCSVLQEVRLRDIMDDLHLSFKQRVKASRGERLIGRDDELFSGKRVQSSHLSALCCLS
jgi:hypothetical protein